MRTQTIQKLRSDSPEFKELLAFLAAEAKKLDSLGGLENFEFEERMYEVTSRLRAKQTLDAILDPLLSTPDKAQGMNLKEYVV